MQHAASYTSTVQPSSHNQCYVLIGKQSYQLPELIPTNSNSGLHSCIMNGQVTHTHTHPFNGPFSGTTRVSRYQKGKTLDFTEARDTEWRWHQLGRMQVCSSLQTDNHASTPPLCFLQAGCPSCRPTNSVKALKAQPLHSQYRG